MCLYAIPLLEDQPELEPWLDIIILLRDIYLIARSWSISREQLESLRSMCIEFVTKWQVYYLEGENGRISSMGVNVHYLLHLGQFYSTFDPYKEGRLD